jgi:hypothetical protein
VAVLFIGVPVDRLLGVTMQLIKSDGINPFETDSLGNNSSSGEGEQSVGQRWTMSSSAKADREVFLIGMVTDVIGI